MNDNQSETIDFLAVGDIVIDDFIALDQKVTEALCDADGQVCKLAMPLGDKIPYLESEVLVAVGNSPNASVSAHRLGLRSALMTHVGGDENGQKCIDRLNEEGVDTQFVHLQKEQPTNFHYVLRYGAERTILIKHAHYTYDFPMDLKPPKMIYFSSVAENAVEYHHQLAQYVKANPETKLAFQPGTFQLSLGFDGIPDIYEVSELFFCNVEEAQKIVKTNSRDLKELLLAVHNHGPKVVCITDGPDGAYCFDSYNNKGYFMPIYPDPAPPKERTGAGDSFSSCFTSFYIKGLPVEDCLMRGPINSMNVVQHVGAQRGLLTEAKVEEFLAQKPDHYTPEVIFSL